MNENSELNAHRVRSIRAIVRDGYLLYTNNFKKIFRAVWLIAIVYALAFAWALNNVISLIPTYIVAFSGGYVDPVSMTVNSMLYIISSLLFDIMIVILASCGFKACYEHYITGEIIRTRHWWGTFPMKTFFKLIIPAICWFFRNWRHWGFVRIQACTAPPDVREQEKRLEAVQIEKRRAARPKQPRCHSSHLR